MRRKMIGNNMSGGYFDCAPVAMLTIIENLEKLINEKSEYAPETLTAFREGLWALQIAYIYTKRIDLLACFDDSEKVFTRG